MKKCGLAILLAIGAAAVNGCGPYQVTESHEMTDGGPMGKHFDAWVKDDNQHSQDLKPQVSRWWAEEKARWPKFRRTAPTAKDFYDQRIEAENEAARAELAKAESGE